MFYWSNLIHLPKALWAIHQQAQIQRKFTPLILGKLLGHLQKQNDGSLQSRDWRRMRDYPFLFNVYFNSLMAELRQKPLSDSEREKITLYAAAGCLYDDFFDDNILNFSQLREICLFPNDFICHTDKQRAFVILMQNLYRQYPDNQVIMNYFEKFYQSQVQSKAQLQTTALNRTDLLKISFDKGGYAQVLSRFLMDNPLKINELEVVYELGAWYQILDDIVDIAADRQAQIQTLATTAPSIETLENELDSQAQKAFGLLRTLDYPKTQKETVIRRFSVIGAAGWVHLQQLKKLQKQSDKQFLLNQYPENELLWREKRLKNSWVAIQFWLRQKY
jgi:hypothetical protein